MTTVPPLPPCCHPQDDRWPLPRPLPGLHLVSLAFEATELKPEDFRRSQVSPPASVARAVAKRQAEYLAGRLCAREALRRAAGQPLTPGQNDDGSPLWPTGTMGSITHTHGWAAAVVGQQHEYAGVGLDAEQIMPDERGHSLSRQILTAPEQERFRQELTVQAGEFVTLVFSLKETLFKALYPLVHRRFYFEHAELVSWQPGGNARLRLLTQLSPDWPIGTELDAQFARDGQRLISLIAVGPTSHSIQSEG
ncbi:4'-phosphopantetheinyl transferase superfamily protein [Marinobacter sp. NP-4(2019)]|uniref:4'-phosphopantetheinyl transferase family protein n=1 Tax=Marinobacter sp. NP-4(2019) TaxID=2488665 RepID=UPI000FC3F0B8|nr:4'-phosphopantetheinyl transferase superfamily protein [Marinobacter sp. NP-4(2019)]AZT83006.1 4'-phosphopantetheinyl transferase superfamily protein [Marinobacter sp. NP-4(2019)]